MAWTAHRTTFIQTEEEKLAQVLTETVSYGPFDSPVDVAVETAAWLTRRLGLAWASLGSPADGA
jgi:hypothetical protein